MSRKQIITAPVTGLYKDKGSKFIAYAWPVATEEAIRMHLDSLKKEHFSARHWCYAWRLGETGDQYRSNDDGEPSGSAGRPILAVLDQFRLSDCLVVVVRYFGGTLLGVRGLIDAYGGAARNALEQAVCLPMPVPREIAVSFSYDLMAEVQKVLNETGLKPTALSYTDADIRMVFRDDVDMIAQLSVRLDRIYGVTLSDEAEKGADN